MPQQTINIGSAANDGTGDTLRNAFDKTNDNFNELYAREEFTSADRTKLDGIEANATADQTGAEIVSAIDTELGQTDWKTGGGGGGAVPVQDDGVQVVATPTAINFTGAGVTVTDVSGVASVAIPGGGASYPSFTGNAGKVLAVNTGETDVEWVDQSGGSGVSTLGPWSDETLNRVFGTAYQNTGTTDRHVSIFGLRDSSTARFFEVSADGSTGWVRIGGRSVTDSGGESFYAVIPPGHFYRITPAGTPTNLEAWAEAQVVAGSSGGSAPFEGFRADLNGGSAVSAGGVVEINPLIFTNEVFDTAGGYDPVTGLYTVPASLNGKYMVFFAGMHLSQEESDPLIQIFLNGTQIARQRPSDGTTVSVTTGPVLVSTGDVLKVSVRCGTPYTVQTDPVTFFSGHVVGGSSSSGSQIEATVTKPAIADFSIDLNSGVASSTDATHCLFMSGAADGSLLRGLLNTAGGADFTITAKVGYLLVPNYNGGGIILRDTAGKYVVFGIVGVNNLPLLEYGQWSDQTTFSSGTNGTGLPSGDVWLRVFYDHSAGTILGSVSLDGENFQSMGATNNYLGVNVDAAGIAVVNRNASIPSAMHFWHYNVA